MQIMASTRDDMDRSSSSAQQQQRRNILTSCPPMILVLSCASTLNRLADANVKSLAKKKTLTREDNIVIGLLGE